MQDFTDRFAHSPMEAHRPVPWTWWVQRCTDLFIGSMIFDMNSRASYPRLSIAGASGGNNSQRDHVGRDLPASGAKYFGVSHGTREAGRGN